MSAWSIADGRVVVLYCDPPLERWGPDEAGHISAHMTLALGVKSAAGIVLIADSRKAGVLDGSLMLGGDDACKILPLGRFGIGLAGNAAMANRIVKLLSESQILESCPDVDVAVEQAEQHLFADFERRYSGTAPNLWPAPASILLAGYSAETPRIYALVSKLGFLPEEPPTYAIGSNTAIKAAAVLSRLLLVPEQPLPTLDQAKIYGVTAIRIAQEIDATVGGPVRMAVITVDGYADVSDEAASIDVPCEDLRRKIRSALRGPC